MRYLILLMLLISPLNANANVNWKRVQQTLSSRFPNVSGQAVDDIVNELEKPHGSAIYLKGDHTLRLFTDELAHLLSGTALVSVVESIREASAVGRFLNGSLDTSRPSLLIWRDLHKWQSPLMKDALSDYAEFVAKTSFPTKLIVEESDGVSPNILRSLRQIDLRKGRSGYRGCLRVIQ